MGLFGSRANVRRGSGTKPRPVALEPGEVETARVVAAALQDQVAWAGGELVLTERRLLFAPLNLADVAGLLQWGLRPTGEPTVGLTAVADLADIAGVERGGAATISHPAAFAVRLADGTTFEFGVFKGRMTATGAAVNNEVRDRFLATLDAAVAATR